MIDRIKVVAYSYRNPKEMLGVIPDAKDIQYLDEIEGPGSGSFSISKLNPKVLSNPNLIETYNIIKFIRGKEVIGAFEIQKRVETVVSENGRSDEIITLSGEGLKGLFKKAIVYPQGALTRRSVDNRNFNFSSPKGDWYIPQNWSAPVTLGKWGSSPWGKNPSDWPDAFKNEALWIWFSQTSFPAYKNAYFRTSFTSVEDVPLTLYLAADDAYSVYVDGSLITSSSITGDNFQKTQQVSLSGLPAGNHTLGIRVFNTEGPAGLLAAIGKVDGKTPDGTDILRAVRVSSSVDWFVTYDDKAVPGVTAGEVLLTLLNEAKSRGVLFPTFLSPTFTTTVDSVGTDFSRSNSWSYTVGKTTMSDVLDSFRDFGIDIWIDPKDLSLNMYQLKGANKTRDSETPTIFYAGRDVLSQEETGVGNIQNSLVVHTTEGFLEQKNAESISKYGVLEGDVDAGVSYNESKVIADRVLELKSGAETGGVYTLLPSGKNIPWRDIQVGDWVTVATAGAYRSRRVMSMSFSIEESGKINYSIEFDTIFQSDQMRLQQYMDKLAKGSQGGSLSTSISNAGNSYTGTTPSTGVPITTERTPSRVVGLKAATTPYWGSDGQPRGRVDLSWTPVTTYTDSYPADISMYEIWVRPQNQTKMSLLTTVTDGVTFSVMGLETPLTYYFEVRALTSKAFGIFSDTLKVDVASPKAEKVKPTKPRVTQSLGLGVVTAEWDGKVEPVDGGTPYLAPAYVQSVTVLAAKDVTGPYTVLGFTITKSGSIPLTDLDIGQRYYFKFRAMDKAGNFLEDSDAVSVTVESVVQDSINNAHQAAQSALDQLAGEAQSALGDQVAAAKTAADAAVTQTVQQYAQSDSAATAPTSGWSDTAPTWTAGKYIWVRTVITYGSGATTTTDPVVVTGNPGSAGPVGPKGDRGATGPKGDTGAAGKSSYTHIAYADTAAGGGFSQDPAGKAYMGVYVDEVLADSSDPSKYAWSLIKGLDGAQGAPGPKGADGRTPYFHTAWADSADGKTNFSTTTPGDRSYLGTYTDYTKADSTAPADYVWAKIEGPQGPKGDRGADGIAGKDGVGITGTVLAYAKSTSGTTPPATGWGTSVPSSTPGQYLWTRTTWTYSDGSSEQGYSVSMWGATGPKGDTGNDGIAGKDGVGITGTVITYAGSASGTTPPSSGWSTSIPTVAAGDFLWTRTVWSYTDGTTEQGYSAAKMGAQGATGVSVTSVVRYYQQGTSKPAKPTTATPSGWSTTEPGYVAGKTLYYTDKVTYSSGSFSFSDVQTSSAYLAAAAAREAAAAAKNMAEGKSVVLTQPDYPGSEYQNDKTFWVDTAARTYAWTGATNASTSTETVDGVVTRTNLALNPSFEGALVAPGEAGATVTLSTEQAHSGAQSMKVVTTKEYYSRAKLNNFGFWSLDAGTYSWSMWIWTDTAQQMRFELAGSSNDIVTTGAGWEFFSGTVTLTARGIGTYIGNHQGLPASVAARTFYVDDVLVERANTVGTYFDGGFAASAANTPKVWESGTWVAVTDGTATAAADAAAAALAASQDFIKDPQFKTGADNVKSLTINATDANAGTLPGTATTYGLLTDNDNWTKNTLITTVPGHVYEWSVWAKVASTNTQTGKQFGLMVWRLTADGNPAQGYSNVGERLDVTALAKWTQVTGRWTAPSDGSWPYVRPSLRAGGYKVLVTDWHVRDVTSVKALEDATASAQQKAQAAGLTADGKNSIFYVKANENLPTSTTTGGPLAQGDKAFRVSQTEGGSNKVSDVYVWNGTKWVLDQMVADSVLVPSSVGNILLSDGAVSARNLLADEALVSKIFTDELVGGRISASMIQADAVNGKTIIGATFQTGMGVGVSTATVKWSGAENASKSIETYTGGTRTNYILDPAGKNPSIWKDAHNGTGVAGADFKGVGGSVKFETAQGSIPIDGSGGAGEYHLLGHVDVPASTVVSSYIHEEGTSDDGTLWTKAYTKPKESAGNLAIMDDNKFYQAEWGRLWSWNGVWTWDAATGSNYKKAVLSQNDYNKYTPIPVGGGPVHPRAKVAWGYHVDLDAKVIEIVRLDPNASSVQKWTLASSVFYDYPGYDYDLGVTDLGDLYVMYRYSSVNGNGGRIAQARAARFPISGTGVQTSIIWDFSQTDKMIPTNLNAVKANNKVVVKVTYNPYAKEREYHYFRAYTDSVNFVEVSKAEYDSVSEYNPTIYKDAPNATNTVNVRSAYGTLLADGMLLRGNRYYGAGKEYIVTAYTGEVYTYDPARVQAPVIPLKAATVREDNSFRTSFTTSGSELSSIPSPVITMVGGRSFTKFLLEKTTVLGNWFSGSVTESGSGQGGILDSDSLRGFSANGTLMTKLDFNTGELTAHGANIDGTIKTSAVGRRVELSAADDSVTWYAANSTRQSSLTADDSGLIISSKGNPHSKITANGDYVWNGSSWLKKHGRVFSWINDFVGTYGSVGAWVVERTENIAIPEGLLLFTIGVRHNSGGEAGTKIELLQDSTVIHRFEWTSEQHANGIKNDWSSATIPVAAGNYTVRVSSIHWQSGFSTAAGLITIDGRSYSRVATVDLL